MTDLSLAPPRERGMMPYVLIAVVVIAAIVTAVWFLNPRTTADLAVTKVDLFAPHTELKASRGAVHVVGTLQTAEDDLYVVANVRMTDKLRIPLFVSGAAATLTSADGSAMDATAIFPRDLARLEVTFPQVAQMAPHPLAFDEIAPGTTSEGQVVFLFPGLTEDAWKQKKDATMEIHLEHQNPLTVKLP